MKKKNGYLEIINEYKSPDVYDIDDQVSEK